MKRFEKYSLIDFQKEFNTEKDCIKHLFALRWENGFSCPRCANSEYYYITKRRLCECKKCKKQVSITSGTVFHKTRTPLVKWFWMIFMMTNQTTGQSISSLQRMLEINLYKTAWLMAHKIRVVMKQRDAEYQLAGLIEVDDAYFGSSKAGKRGRGAKGKAKVVGGVEVKANGKPKRVFLQVVKDLTGEVVKEVLENEVDKGASIKTDGFSTYKKLKKEGLIVENVIIGDAKEASKLFPWIHKVFSNVKAIIRGVHKGISMKYLSNYLAEFSYKFNRRWNNKIIFSRFVFVGLVNKAITLPELRD